VNFANTSKKRGRRGQLLYGANATFRLRITGHSRHQQALCCAQGSVLVGAPQTPAAQQFFGALAAAAGYWSQSLDRFAREIHSNTPSAANQVIGGLSAIADWNRGPVTITAWRTVARRAPLVGAMGNFQYLQEIPALCSAFFVIPAQSD
jgi:iron complex outermembrane recepter protein